MILPPKNKVEGGGGNQKRRARKKAWKEKKKSKSHKAKGEPDKDSGHIDAIGRRWPTRENHGERDFYHGFFAGVRGGRGDTTRDELDFIRWIRRPGKNGTGWKKQ